MERDELLDLIPAYALSALDAEEHAAVEAALARDPDARALLAEYQQVAAQLVTLAPLRPAPERLQTDLRQRLAAARPGSSPRAASLRPAPRRGLLGRVSGVNRVDRLLAAAAAITIVVVGALLLWGALAGEDAAPSSAYALYESLMAQPASLRYAVAAGEVSEAVTGELVVSADGDQAVLRTEALPAIGEDETFQIWLIDHDGARTSAGLFRPDPAEATYVQVPLGQPIAAYQAVGVSLEPASGSPYPDQPTGPCVLAVPLT